MISFTRDYRGMSFNYHRVKKSCILMSDVICMAPSSLNSASHLFVHFYPCSCILWRINIRIHIKIFVEFRDYIITPQKLRTMLSQGSSIPRPLIFFVGLMLKYNLICISFCGYSMLITHSYWVADTEDEFEWLYIYIYIYTYILLILRDLRKCKLIMCCDGKVDIDLEL